MRQKHVPQRTCLGCRQVQSKRTMIRVVRTPEGQIVIDRTGKQNGRGAYLCPRQACWQAALKGDRLSQALQVEITDAIKTMLSEFAATLTEQVA